MFNKWYCYVATGGGLMYDLRDPHLAEPKQFQAIDRRYAHQKIDVGTDENPKSKPFMKMWLESEKANKCDGTIFRPNGTPYIEQGGRRYLNTWRSLGVVPARGDWSLLQAHLRDNVCVRADADGFVPDPDEYRNFAGWMVALFQRLGDVERKTPVVVNLLSPEEGTGKSIVGKYWRRLYGRHGKVVSKPSEFLDEKNAILDECCALVMEEASFAGDPRHDKVLKELFSGEELNIRRMYQDVQSGQPNYMTFLAISNDEVPMAITQHSRRHHVLRVAPHRKGDKAYFAAIVAQMNAGGLAAMAWDLLHWTPPGGDWTFLDRMGEVHTEAAGQVLKARLLPFENWVLDWIFDGGPDCGMGGAGLDVTHGNTETTMKEIAAAFAVWWDMHKGEYDQRERGKVKVHYAALGKPFRNMLGEGITDHAVNCAGSIILADREALLAILRTHTNRGYIAALADRERA